jgi:hypothetical protein
MHDEFPQAKTETLREPRISQIRAEDVRSSSKREASAVQKSYAEYPLYPGQDQQPKHSKGQLSGQRFRDSRDAAVSAAAHRVQGHSTHPESGTKTLRFSESESVGLQSKGKQSRTPRPSTAPDPLSAHLGPPAPAHPEHSRPSSSRADRHKMRGGRSSQSGKQDVLQPSRSDQRDAPLPSRGRERGPHPSNGSAMCAPASPSQPHGQEAPLSD